jgi:PucR family transcriptional regulator, purine catabolism regulatory protein
MITVDELVAVPELGMTYLAGRAGGGRPITWAHTCDLAEPWLWVGPGDLLMTTGGGLPAEPAEQARWLERLAATGCCGAMVGPKQGTPELSAALREQADALRFPLIEVDFELEFAQVARAVIESAMRVEQARIVAVRRLYDAWVQALHLRAGLSERLRVVSGSLGWRLRVLDGGTGAVLADSHTRSAASRPPADRTAEAGGAREVPVPGPRPARLVAEPDRAPVDDDLPLQHMATLVGVELEQQGMRRDEQREAGAVLLGEVLDGTLPPAALAPELRRRGLTGPLVLACFEPGPDGHPEWLHHAPALRGRFPLLLERDGRLLALLPDRPELVQRLRGELGDWARAGVSVPLGPTGEPLESSRQARLACGHAGPGEVVRYDRLSGLLPRTVTEAVDVVERCLGPLLAYDREQGTELVHTVRVFLEHDGSWRATGSALGVHRQTLVHRWRTVTRLTGLKPGSTEGTARLWLALEAARHTGVIDIKNDH